MDYSSSDEEEAEDFGMEELQEIEYAFGQFATVVKEEEPEGSITVDDLEFTLRSVGVELTEGEIFAVLEEFDPDNTGLINFKTFLLILKKNLKPMTEDDLKLCFAIFDKDSNGQIGTPEIRHVAADVGGKYNDEEIEDMLREVDADGDGRISFDDFVYFMTRR
ncbi:neo-calmodulin-like [Harmonia axyridis]|uniref:neo-calmodulin-like n=1 Tax=Harmonia axyridis TaxID=115357 RepID=UPI001E278CFE|nr:neo-calmodulin-like [Harmonia axyridis]